MGAITWIHRKRQPCDTPTERNCEVDGSSLLLDREMFGIFRDWAIELISRCLASHQQECPNKDKNEGVFHAQ